MPSVLSPLLDQHDFVLSTTPHLHPPPSPSRPSSSSLPFFYGLERTKEETGKTTAKDDLLNSTIVNVERRQLQNDALSTTTAAAKSFELSRCFFWRFRVTVTNVRTVIGLRNRFT
jgi:hypothetical protein